MIQYCSNISIDVELLLVVCLLNETQFRSVWRGELFLLDSVFNQPWAVQLHDHNFLNTDQTFDYREDAEDAIYYLDGTSLYGRVLDVQLAQSDRKSKYCKKRSAI